MSVVYICPRATDRVESVDISCTQSSAWLPPAQPTLLPISHKAKYEDLSLLSAATFELPALFSQRLRGLSGQLYNGVGFQIIHGLDPSKYTSKQQIIVYAGVSAHICPQRGLVGVRGTGVLGQSVESAQGDDLLLIGCTCRQPI